MRALLVLLSIGVIGSGIGLAAMHGATGELISYAEAEHAMGADCSSNVPKLASWNCFDNKNPGACGGCGCAKVYGVIPGAYTPDKATACKTDGNCSVSQSVSSTCSK